MDVLQNTSSFYCVFQPILFALFVGITLAMESHQLPPRGSAHPPPPAHKHLAFPNPAPRRILKEPKVIGRATAPAAEEETIPPAPVEERKGRVLPPPPAPSPSVPYPTPSAIHGLKPKPLHPYPSPHPYHPAPHHYPYVPHGPPPPYHQPPAPAKV